VLGQTSTTAKANAKPLRRELTDAARKLWRYLRGAQLGVRFRRQHPYLNYVLDFVCLETKVVIEIDGSQHLESLRDAERDRTLAAAGFRVLRFWNNQVFEEIDAVKEQIFAALNPIPTPAPPLEGEGSYQKDALS
jgi:very-short-patch-repair endonuclease